MNLAKIKPVKVLGLLVSIGLVFGLALSYPQPAKALSWTQVNSDGFGTVDNWGAIRLFTYGDYIYAGGGNLISGGSIYRSTDGNSWEAVTTNGFGNVQNGEIGPFASFGNYLYVGTVKANYISPELIGPPTTGTEIWRSATGAPGTWTKANTDGFNDDANNVGTYGLQVFGNYLYAGTSNDTTGAEMWRTSDGTTWAQANSDGFGDDVNTDIRSFEVFGGQLYAGTSYNSNDFGGHLYRSSDGTTWNLVDSNAFGDKNNYVINLLARYNNYLYAGTINTTTGTELWRSTTGDNGSWSQVNANGFGSATNTWSSEQLAVYGGRIYIGTRKTTGGAQLMSSATGNNDWQQEGANGFGDTNNYAIYALSFKNQLFAGFSNTTTGSEIWRTSDAVSLAISPDKLPDGTFGVTYDQNLAVVSGSGPFTFSFTGDLPPGLNLTTDGRIYGSPSRIGTYTFTVNLSDSGVPAQIASKQYSITIKGAAATATAAVSKPAELPETGMANNSGWGVLIWHALQAISNQFIKF